MLTTPNHVVFYKPYQRYRRALRDPRGDRCLWLEVSPELLARRPAGAGGAVRRAHLPARGRARPPPARPSPRPTGCWPRRPRCGCSAALGGRGRARSRPRAHARRPRRARRGGEGAARRALGRAAVAARRRRRAHTSPPSTSRACSAPGPGSRSPATCTGCGCERAVDRLAAEPGVDLSRLARRPRLLLAQPLQRPLPRRLRSPAVRAARRATEHDRGSERAPRRLEPRP